MQRTFLHSKLHGIHVTHADLHYQGSLGLDIKFMQAAQILPNEQVFLYNITNGARLVTYAIPLAENSKIVCANGACAHLVHAGHQIIVCTYASFSSEEWADFSPTVLIFNERNEWNYLNSQEELLQEQLLIHD